MTEPDIQLDTSTPVRESRPIKDLSYHQKLGYLVAYDVAQQVQLQVANRARPRLQNIMELSHQSNKQEPRLPLFRLLLLDFFLGQLFIGPLITTCWRASWVSLNLVLDDHLFPRPGHKWLNTFVCVLVGIAATNSLQSLSQSVRALAAGTPIEDTQEPHPSTTSKFFLISRLYTLVSFGSSIMMWKGWWDICSLEGTSWSTGSFMFVIGSMLMMSLKSGRTNVGFPLTLSVDEPQWYLSHGTFFQRNKDHEEPGKCFLGPTFINCVMTTLVEVVAITSWYGVWTLENRMADQLLPIEQLKLPIHLSPDVISVSTTLTEWQSALGSLLLGFTTALLVFILQLFFLYLIKRAPKEYSMTCHFMGNNVIAIIGLVSTVSNLRGNWLLLDILLLKPATPLGQRLLSLGGTFLVAFPLLVLLGCASSLHGGVSRDPKLQDGGFLVPGFYLTHWFIKRKLSMDQDDFDADLTSKFIPGRTRTKEAGEAGGGGGIDDLETPVTEVP